jgi:hypothetical protein
MATPNYQGPGQPAEKCSSWFGSWLGGTPAYKGAGQPSSMSSGYGSSGPAYKPAPETCGQRPITIVIPQDVIEQQ